MTMWNRFPYTYTRKCACLASLFFNCAPIDAHGCGEITSAYMVYIIVGPCMRSPLSGGNERIYRFRGVITKCNYQYRLYCRSRLTHAPSRSSLDGLKTARKILLRARRGAAMAARKTAGRLRAIRKLINGEAAVHEQSCLRYASGTPMRAVTYIRASARGGQ